MFKCKGWILDNLSACLQSCPAEKKMWIIFTLKAALTEQRKNISNLSKGDKF